MKLSPCRRFVVFEALHIDREAIGPLASWAEVHGLALQDAIQLAIVGFGEVLAAASARPKPTFPSSRA
jgi:hypothetical protein